jgi:L-ascorbate metabolism protein UlaG (beta-lactamase superfamily)
MNITWYGLNCFKIQGKDISLITDPFGKEIGLKSSFGAADIITIGLNSQNYNNSEVIKDEPFVIDGPGEYEIKKVVVRGIESNDANVIYKIILDDVKICHLGALSQKSLEAEQLNHIGDVDILFVPVGGQMVIDSKDAENIINQIEPRIVIPMHYKIDGMKGEAEKLADIHSFCQNHGIDPKETVSKFSIKEKDLPQEETQFVVMDLGK